MALARGRGAIAGIPSRRCQAALARHAPSAVPGLPAFQGGAAGYLGLRPLPPPRDGFPRRAFDDLDLPDLCLGLYDWTIAWDHVQERDLALLDRPSRERGPRAPSERAARARMVRRGSRQRLRGAAGRAPARTRRRAGPDRPRAGRACPGSSSTFSRDGVPAGRGAHAGVRLRGGHLPGEPLAAPRGAGARSTLPALCAPARAQRGALRRLLRLRRGGARERVARALPAPGGRRRGDAADQGHLDPRRHEPAARLGARASRSSRARRTGPRT